MLNLKTAAIFFLHIFFSATSTECKGNTLNPEFCLTQVCTYEEPVSRYVQFPFLITNESFSGSCGYPGFDLLCDGDFKLMINLPHSGLFSVKEIDYVKQELWLNDPDNCLARKLLSINDSNFVGKSPFIPVFQQTYWFYNCSNDFINSSDDSIRPIKCLSGQNYGVFASTENIVTGNFSTCDNIGPVRVPVRKRSKNGREFSTQLSDNIMLTWATPRECGDCYRRSGICRFKNNTSLDVGCFNLPRRGLSKSALFAIALAFVTPIIFVTTCIAYFISKAIHHRRRTNRARLPNLLAQALASAVSPQPERVTQGLDQVTIESYPKVVLGESRRLPKPDDNNCPICLGEYMAKETLKSIPDCCHCFHADCIDEWLKLNASCPVCRNSPTKSPLNNA